MSEVNSKDNCVGEYPALWRIMYSHQVPVRVPSGPNGDTDFSHMETRAGQFDVIALTDELAQAAFVAGHPPTLYTRLTNPEKLCYIDAAVHVGRSYGGHFS